ncbi:MAG: SDR family NAD(P)-dependent oxidoreductase [Rhodospirillales bacterium]|jgi:NAD(P)-dependent dehydrogenase (short-subunit alcohol dehydrogenase family)|nr:SDR family NAD(P)-dependent oxidoreductase [Rhodospirillales bacterium]
MTPVGGAKPRSPKGRLTGRVALVTGASRGIGRAVAKRFADEGAELVITARTQGALEELDDEIRATARACVLVTCDLRDFDAIDRMGAAVFERFGRLDVLVANAAQLGMLAPLHHIDPGTWEATIAVNLTANWRLIRSFDPLLRMSEAGRAIFVTSGAAQVPNPYWGIYATSKAALEMMVRTYAAEIAKTSVRANLVNPGATRTRMRAEAFPGEDADRLKAAEAVTDLFVELAGAACARNGQVLDAG